MIDRADIRRRWCLMIEPALIRACKAQSKKYPGTVRGKIGAAGGYVRNAVIRALKADGVDFTKITPDVYVIDRPDR
jgi:hypothetical protein